MTTWVAFDSMLVPEGVPLEATVRSQNGPAMIDQSISFESRDASTVSVDPRGVATAVEFGAGSPSPGCCELIAGRT